MSDGTVYRLSQTKQVKNANKEVCAHARRENRPKPERKRNGSSSREKRRKKAAPRRRRTSKRSKRDRRQEAKDEHQGARGCALRHAVRDGDGRYALPARAAGDVVAALNVPEPRGIPELGARRERSRVDAAARDLGESGARSFGFTGVVICGADKSELFVVFLPSKLHTEDVAKLSADKSGSFVQGAVGTAVSSTVIPHTTRASSLTHALNSGLIPFKEIPADKLEAFLADSEGKLFASNGKTELLVVRIGSGFTLPETDALIKAASEVLSTATKGSVDFALTGDVAESKQIAGRRLAANTTTTTLICGTGLQLGFKGGRAFCFSHFVHMTPDILTGLLFGFFFIFLAYVGLSMLTAIQTPIRYPHTGPPRGKEF